MRTLSLSPRLFGSSQTPAQSQQILQALASFQRPVGGNVVQRILGCLPKQEPLPVIANVVARHTSPTLTTIQATQGLMTLVTGGYANIQPYGHPQFPKFVITTKGINSLNQAH
jgi:hypothetical protein